MEGEQRSSSGNHGGRALACARRGRAPGRAKASEGGVETHGRSVLEQQGTRWHVARRLDVRRPWGACFGAWRPHRQNVEHVARVGVGKVGAELGQIWADLDLGPKTKFEARELLYIFYLKCTVIRVVD